jgi:hypothetical protein
MRSTSSTATGLSLTMCWPRHRIEAGKYSADRAPVEQRHSRLDLG